ncbi:MAG: matrixin family metalloprotease [Chloroflexi bacterium]|nr:matrixin family metalloprotease [Chloroflexota bacterium]
MRQQITIALVVALIAVLLTPSVALATDGPSHDVGTLGIGAPYGPANQDPNDPLRVLVTYRVRANGNLPASAVDAVNAAIAAWEAAIDTLEIGGWDFDLVAFTGSPPDKPDIDIRLKRGGGLVAGQALSRFDQNGFRVGAKIIISGSFLGTASEAVTIKEIAMHELGHALSLGHHSNEDDLMGRTVGHAAGLPITSISVCDLGGFEEAHHWLTTEVSSTPHLNHVTSINC